MGDLQLTHASGRQSGALDLLLERAGATTQPTRALARPPLQLSRARYDVDGEPGTAAFTLVHLGGVLENDRYDIQVELGPNAAAQITTAAATQVLRMPHGDARQDTLLSLAPGSRLHWLPEPVILFGGARFTSTTRVEIAAGAQLALLDVLVPGRLARGELFQFERYETRLEVCDPSGRCLVAERAVLEPRHMNLARNGMFGDTPVLGSLYLLGDTLDAERWCACINQDASNRAATLLPNDAGLLIRTLGHAASTVQTSLRQFLRQFAESRIVAHQ
ncbi:MAG TPA: urease accessory protein UreD [Roseiflexaceae bacterium]|nr:urease accessory protein UreD [Roseiflexaceae bacterium]